MKKIRSMYRSYMLRPVVYKVITRAMAAAVICLLWERYVSDGHFTIWEAPALVCGVGFLCWAWGCYLRLDGIAIRGLGLRKPGQRPRKPHATRSMVDFADEKIVSFDELEPRERTFCSMLANLVVGLPLLAAGVVAGML